MKKRKEPTDSVACRVSLKLKDELILEAAQFERSLAEQIMLLVHLSWYGDDNLQSYRDRISEANSQLEVLKQELKFEQDLLWKQEPYATMLTDVLKNDGILAKLFAEYGQKYVPTALFVQEGFNQNALIRGETINGNYYFLTGKYGWAFTNKNRDFIAILKRY